jgi:hypothetical protein
MKHYLSGIVIALSLALVLVLGVVALAENEPQAPELPAASDLQTPAEAPATDDGTQATQDNTALQEALQAYQAAKESTHEQALQDELDGYVAAGKLTQAQADLIMNYYKERQAMRNGTCPSCGYQFQNGNGFGGRGGKGGRMNGNGFGGRGGKGGHMYGDFGSQMAPGTPEGMSAQPDMQAAPQMGANGGI